MKAPEGAELGRCVFCRELVYNSQASIQHGQAVFKKSKLVCGNCLIDLKTPVLEAFIAHEQEEEIYKDTLLEKVKQYGWSLNPATGKLQKIAVSDDDVAIDKEVGKAL